ncbi:MAG: molecular chaperone [Desulfobacterales bacterium C00003060]|nr:MAG: molecular chaperone [Desulfobacterales bacterium S3730MH5]OEU78212.1 MAG: molecular chaperone [Desulfobacterales bacterium S5133MH4]OEU78414.1 MAG: molecular chaperone [Desulfobacterales bacterium C00003060]
MDLVPWKPFGELASLRSEMDKLWNRFFGERPFPRLVSQDWLPSVDVSETKDKLLIKAELPGLEAKDINVSVSGDVLTIKGEKTKEEEDKDEHYYSCERYSGTFQRSFHLPVDVQVDKVQATFDKGVLEVTLPKAEEAKKKEIEIKVK